MFSIVSEASVCVLSTSVAFRRVNLRSVTIETDVPTKGNLPLNGDITSNLVITVTRCDFKSEETRQLTRTHRNTFGCIISGAHYACIFYPSTYY